MLKLSSSNKKIVIISDVHNDITRLDNILKKECADINICLGDWFDSFVYNDVGHYASTAVYLKNVFLPNPKNYTLFGNHDLNYLFKSPVAWCSGYKQWKYDEIEYVLHKDRESIIDKFHWAIVLDDILLTHAGLDHRLLNPMIKSNDDIFEYIDDASKNVISKLKYNQEHWFYQAGRSRGGYADVGGIVWCDFDREFEPIDGLRQIVGHTSQYKSSKAAQHHSEGFANITDANNICIDCGLNQYITMTNGKIEIKNYADL